MHMLPDTTCKHGCMVLTMAACYRCLSPPNLFTHTAHRHGRRERGWHAFSAGSQSACAHLAPWEHLHALFRRCLSGYMTYLPVQGLSMAQQSDSIQSGVPMHAG